MAGFRERAPFPSRAQIIPCPAVTVIIDLRDSVAVTGGRDGRRLQGSIAVGFAPGVIQYGGQDAECLEMRLSPVTARAVLGDPAEISGRVIALRDLWGRDADRIEERLRAAGSWRARFVLAEHALARRVEAGRGVDPEVAFAWRRLAADRGRVRVARLADEAGWSRKRLWSRFRAQLGITPKRAAGYVRFDYALHRLAAGVSPAAVAAECGYADQPHLTRDFVSSAGMTPAVAATTPWLAVEDVVGAADGNISSRLAGPVL